jgi:hypothetical protein
MRSSAFIKNFAEHEDPEIILGATYIVASKSIVIKTNYLDNTIALLYPPPEVLIELGLGKVNRKHNGRYIFKYEEYLLNNIESISKIIRSSIMKHSLIIIMTTDKEEDTLRILKIIRDWIFDNFGYVVKKYGMKSKLSDIYTDEYDGILELCEYYIKRQRKRELKKAKESDYYDKRKWFYDNYSRILGKEIETKLKHKWGIDINYKDCTIEELFEYAVTYLI